MCAVEVTYSFFHCAKAYMRSRLWQPASWPAKVQAYSLAPYFAEDPGDEAEIAALDTRSRAVMEQVQAAIDGKDTEVSTRRVA